MNDLIILGTDTDAGKTTFALLWLTAFADRFEYWKPVETGPSDSESVARFVPAACVHPPVQRFEKPVSPPLAAHLAGTVVRSAEDLASARPVPQRPGSRLLIETFGSPFSPLNDTQLQLALIQRLRASVVLVSSSALGAIGRTLQCLAGLGANGLMADAIVLIGPPDSNAAFEIARHARTCVISISPPEVWDADGLLHATTAQMDGLELLLLQVCTTGEPAAQARGEPNHGAGSPLARAAGSLDIDRLLERDGRVVWHPYTPLEGADPPLVCRGAQDEFLELADGRRVIDGISSWWTILHGHRHPPLVSALQEALGLIDHVHFAGITHCWGVELAEALLRSVGWDDGRVFYSDNGSTAVEVALKMAYQFWCHHGEPERTRFVGFEHGYHGDTFGAMAVSRDPVFFGTFEPLLLQADILALEPGRLDEHLRRHGHETAALIVEPLVQGAGGMRMHSAERLGAVAEVARGHNVLFIADEVMTGGGRTGQRWAHRAAGIVPDLICAAKTLTGGMMPLAATLASKPVVAAFATADRRRTFFHGHSFTGHPLACAVALANVRLGEDMTAPQNMEAFWRHSLAPLRDRSGVKDVRWCGSIGAIELDVPGGYLADAGRAMRAAALERGVLLRPLGNVLYAMPPFCTSPQSLERIAEAMHAAVQAAG